MEWMNGMNEWWMIEWMNRMNEWIIWMNDEWWWSNEWMIEWMNEWIME